MSVGHMHIVTTVLSLVLQFAAGPGEKHKFSGPVMSVTESQVVVQMGTESLTFVVTKDTKITLNGKDAKVSELKANDVAEVSSEGKVDDAYKALSIQVTRSATAPKATR